MKSLEFDLKRRSFKTNDRKSWKGYLLLATATITCPCHLPFILTILGGTALAAFLQENLALTLLGLTVYFLFALIIGLKLVGHEKP